MDAQLDREAGTPGVAPAAADSPDSEAGAGDHASATDAHNEPDAAAAGGEQTDSRPRKAKSVPLDKPVKVETQTEVMETVEPVDPVTAEKAEGHSLAAAAEQEAKERTQPLIMLDTEVPPSTTTRLSWSPSQSMEGIATPAPVLIVNGARRGPVLCLTAAIHGDELNGIEIVRRVTYNLDPENLAGTVIGVPIVNLQGFHRSSRYLTDRRDLNRYFPGNPDGSSASRIAYSFFEEVIRHCDALVDLHTGSFHRTNMPQLRADLRNEQVRQLTKGFGATVVLHNDGASGTLRRAAVEAGIPAVTLEAGESMRLQEAAVEHGVNGITTLMSKMGMLERFSFWGDPEPVYSDSVWVRADQGGILFSNVELADTVEKGDLLGEVTDPITNIKSAIVSPHDGRVIGMALNQVMLPGFAAFHIAIEAPPELFSGEDGDPEDEGDAPAPTSSSEDPDMPDSDADLSDTDDSD